MVYGGKPSTGCQNCRQRRIKCDEARPHCRACVRTGRTCPGYQHPLDVALRGQTAFQRKKKGAPGKQSSASKAVVPATTPSSSDDSISTIVDIPHTPETLVSSVSPVSTSSDSIPHTLEISRLVPPVPPVPTFNVSIPRSIYLPMEDTVIPLFFNSYLYLPKDPQISNGFLDLLPQFYSETQVGSSVHLSLLAVSAFSVAAWTGERNSLQLAEHSFLRALRKTREVLQTDIDGNLNEILLTVLLLSLYEDFVSKRDRQLPPRDHLRGAIALINSRRPEQLDSPSCRLLADGVEHEVIRTSMGLAHPMVPTPKVWPLTAPIAQTAPEQLQMASSGLVNLRLAWESLASRPPSQITESEILHLMSQAQELDSKLVNWVHTVPPNWLPSPATMIPQSVRAAGVFNDRCDCYSDLWVAATWNSYRDSRIVVQKIILSCLRMLTDTDTNINASSPSNQATLAVKSTAEATIQSLAMDICACVPFLLGSQMESVQLNPYKVEYPEAEGRPLTQGHQQTAPLLGGWFLITFLGNLCTSGLCLSEEHLGWIRGQMQRILQIYNFGFVPPSQV